MSQSWIFGGVSIASKRIAKIEQVVADEAGPVLDDDRIEIVCWFSVGVVQPCREYIQPTQVPAVFVRHDVVRVITSSALKKERTDTFTFDGEAGHDSKRSVWIVRDLVDEMLNIMPCHLPRRLAGRFDQGLAGKAQVRQLQVHDFVFR